MPSARVETSPPLAGTEENRPGLSWHPGVLWAYFRQLLVLGGFFGTGLVVSPLCALAGWIFGRRIAPSDGQNLIRWLFAHWLRLSIRIGVFQVDFPDAQKLKNSRGLIIAPNHPSLVDAVIVLAAVPRVVCIMRAALIRSPCLGGAARLAGYVTNDNGPSLIRESVEKLRQGENLLIFPEGTRTQSGPVKAFKPGFALIAARARAPIQTLLIERDGLYLSKGFPLLGRADLPIRLRIHLGEVFTPAEGESAQELSARLERYFAAHLENSGENIRLTGPLTP